MASRRRRRLTAPPGAPKPKRSSGRAARTGTLSVSRRGRGYVDLDAQPEGVRIERHGMGGALHGDQVEIRLAPSRGRPTGRIIRILDRPSRRLTGAIQADGAEFAPYDRRFPPGPLTGAPAANTAKRGVACLAPARAGGEVGYTFQAALHAMEDARHDAADVAREFGWPVKRHRQLRSAAEAAVEVTPSRTDRLDLTDWPAMTIDPDSAQDFDDALSFRARAGGGAEIGIHIADVSWYVRPDGAIDQDARARGTSVYLPGLTLHMLPEALAAAACSLKPGTPRPAVSVIVALTPAGSVASWRLERTMIQSRARLTYGQALAVLEGRAKHPEAAALRGLGTLAQSLRRQRLAAGGLQLEAPEYEVELDAKGQPIRFVERQSDSAHALVEEFMLLANRLVGGWARQADLPILYRVHEAPRWERLLEFEQSLADLGIDAPKQNLKNPRALMALVDAASQRLRPWVTLMLLRALEKAEYRSEDAGHYGLGFEGYCHFTSPIRRYPDLHTHRVLLAAAEALGGAGPSHRDAPAKALSRVRRQFRELADALGPETSAAELTALRTERAVHKLKALRALVPRLGEELTGVVTSKSASGTWVWLDCVPVDGFVPRRRQARHRFGRGGAELELGQSVVVKVSDLSLPQRELTLEWVRNH